MRRRFRVTLLSVYVMLLLFGCSEKTPAGGGKKNRGPAPGAIHIVFSLPGDDIGGKEHQEILNALKAAIQSQGAGEIMRSGYGMGSMELVVAVGDAGSIGEIKRIISEIYPDARYRIENISG